jgi:uncharacterized membrane protein YeaQ/YmgE (transglycosylase-associated protein family)
MKMLELNGWDVGMSFSAALLLVIGGVLIGVALQLIGEVRVGWEFVLAAIAAVIGGYVGSEAFGTWGPAFEGLYLAPALIGAVVLGVVVDAATRYVTRGSYVHGPRPI